MIFGQQSRSSERSHQLKRTQDQKRLRGFLRLADLGHLAVEGEPLVGKKFSRLISGVVSKLETRYGSALPTKVRSMSVGGGQVKRGKENLASSPQPPSSPVPRVPLLEVNSVVEKVCIPMGKQLARTPPKDPELVLEPNQKSEENEQTTPSKKRVSSFYSPSPSDTSKKGLRKQRRNQIREKVKVSPSEFDLSLVPTAGVQLPRTPELPRNLETPSPPPQPSPQAPGNNSLPLPPPPGQRGPSSAPVNPQSGFEISQHVSPVLQSCGEHLRPDYKHPHKDFHNSPPLPPPPPALLPQPSTSSNPTIINQVAQVPATLVQRPISPDAPASNNLQSNPTTPHISNLVATHSIPTGRQLAATPATGNPESHSRRSMPEPSGK